MDTDDLKIHRWGDVGDGYLGPAFHRRFRAGQILYGSRRTYLRKVAVADFDGVCANTTFVLETTDPDRLAPGFLPFVMTSEPFHAFAIRESKGSVNPYVNWSDIAQYEFDLPRLDEQKRIADLLWSLKRHLLRVEAARHAASALVMQLRAENFQRSRGGVRADEVFEITIGRQRAPQHESGDYVVPYLRSANVTPAGIDVSDVKSMNFTPVEQTKFRLAAGDVLVSEASASQSSVGMPAVWKAEMDGPVCFQNTLLRYRAVDGRSLPGFVEQYCRWAFESGEFLYAASGTNIRHIGVRGATAMRLEPTPIAEQEAFVESTGVASRMVDRLGSELDTLRLLWVSLRADLFGDR